MDIIIPSDIIKGILSKKKKTSEYVKGKLQLITIQNKPVIQLSLFTEKQVFHKNYEFNEINNVLINLLENNFDNMELFTKDYIYGYRITSKGKVLSNKRKNNETLVQIEHNKKKNYLLEEGMIIPPLIDLGVMTSDGNIVKAHYDKFKQINRFLEIINDSIKNENNLKIIDFGCGKSYLTFILYYYLVEIKGISIDIIGLDLKEDVINNCNLISKKYGYDQKLKFFKGDISKFKETDSVDMIVTLHACDTATDYALYHAINMKCRYIFSVPCCQHEINSSLSNDYMHPVNKFGILKERFSAIITDAIRANILQYFGYKTQVLEFVDTDSSLKNLLIRATLSSNLKNEKIKKEIDDLVSQMGIDQTLYKLVFKDL